MMDRTLLERLLEISPEEKRYQNGLAEIQKDLYTRSGSFEIDSALFLKQNRLITVRPHSRFIDFPQHGHNYIEIMYVYHGSVTHVIDHKELVMEQGDMILLNQHVQHSVRRAEYEDIGINFIALPEFFDIPLHMLHEYNVIAEFLAKIFKRNSPQAHYLLFQMRDHAAVRNLIENMVYSMLRSESNSDILNQYSMGLVFLYLLERMESLKENSSQDYKEIMVQSALKYIDQWYPTANLGKIAQDFHQSESSVSKIIKQKTGCTFQELLIRKRFQKAVAFLVETNLPIEKIVYKIGYENHSYFYRQFKERYGMSPKKYRVEHRERESIRI